jgi:tetratricopeptide (TPR) repeat protein
MPHTSPQLTGTDNLPLPHGTKGLECIAVNEEVPNGRVFDGQPEPHDFTMTQQPKSSGPAVKIRKLMRAVSIFFMVGGATCLAATNAKQSSVPQVSNTITVSGTVRNSTGQPVAGASVFLREKVWSKSVQTKTNADGTFTVSTDRPGSYTLRAEHAASRAGGGEFFQLAAGESKHMDLVLAAVPFAAMELNDEPDFTVAGVTDWSNVGLHGSDTTSRTSESLARETLELTPGDAGKTPAFPRGKYAAALDCEAKGDFVRAREQTRKALATGDDAEGHHLLGELDERLDDPLDSVREYEQAARMNQSEQNYFDWGAELLLHKAAQPSVEVFTKGAALHPDSPRMLAGLAAAFYAVGSYDDAARRLCAASDLKSEDPAPYLFLGQIEKSTPTSLPCSEEKLARFAREQPDNALADYYYAFALHKRQRDAPTTAGSQQIKTLLESAVSRKPDLGEAWVQLGILYFEQNEFARAIAAYEQAIKVSPQLGEAHYRLSLAYKRTGDETKARREFAAYQQAEAAETAAVEEQRRALKQFLIILKDQPVPTGSAPPQ